MAVPVDVTGRWAGHYWQHSQPHAISAELVQEGSRLTGRMRDQVTEAERSLFEAALDAGLPPGADERLAAELRRLTPGAAPGPIRCVWRLPPDSVLEGEAQGDRVSFLKTYQGDHFSGYRVGDQHLGLEASSHAVHYRGRVSADGTMIEGRWWIDPPPDQPMVRRTEGDFLLRRQPPLAEAAHAAAGTPLKSDSP